MSATLTPEEAQLLAHVPETDLVDLAAELDLAVPEVIRRDELVGQAIVGIAQRARAEGLPLSQYDREDLEALPGDHLAALAHLVGAEASVDGLLKAGRKTYKVYRKQRPGSQVAMMLPMLLRPLARYAAETR